MQSKNRWKNFLATKSTTHCKWCDMIRGARVLFTYTQNTTHTLNSKVKWIQNKRRSKCDSRERTEANANVTNTYTPIDTDTHTFIHTSKPTNQRRANFMRYFSLPFHSYIHKFFYFFFVRSFGFICQYIVAAKYTHHYHHTHNTLIYIFCALVLIFLLLLFVYIPERIFFLLCLVILLQ